MLRSSRPFALFVLLPLLAGGCGSSSQTPQEGTPASSAASPGGASRDACELITADEAAKILGSATKLTARSMSAERSICDYVTDAYESFTIEAVWKDGATAIAAARSGGRLAAQAAGGSADAVVNDVMGVQRVESLGDEAYFSRRTTSYVRKGDVQLIIQNAGLNDPAREHWEALVRAALARL